MATYTSYPHIAYNGDRWLDMREQSQMHTTSGVLHPLYEWTNSRWLLHASLTPQQAAKYVMPPADTFDTGLVDPLVDELLP